MIDPEIAGYKAEIARLRKENDEQGEKIEMLESALLGERKLRDEIAAALARHQHS